MNIYETLKKPFFVLAPMEDVTDVVFRTIVADCAPPDIFFTEFANVDGIQSPGRQNVSKRLIKGDKDKPLIAQIWGTKPDNYYKTAKELAEDGGFAGIDINMGCPDKSVVKNNCCSALAKRENWDYAAEIIAATKEGAGNLPVSVKTRLGFNEVDFGWSEFLLQQDIVVLTMHGRTRKQMSKVPADWAAIGQVARLRDTLAPKTLVVGNGDVITKRQGQKLAEEHRLDGIMIGRGVFQDPYVFANESPWLKLTKQQRIDLYRRHVELFAAQWKNNERKVHTLNKFCKIYISNFDGAKELRDQLMQANSTDELIALLSY